MAKIYQLLAVVGIANLLAGGGVIGYLVATGKLTPQRLEHMAAALRGEAEPAGVSTSQPASAPADHATDDEVGAARSAGHADAHGVRPGETVDLRRRHAQLESLLLERARQDIAARQRLLDSSLQTLMSKAEEFEAGKVSWQQQRKKLTEADSDAGFLREVEYVSGLSPRLAKEHLSRTWASHQPDAVRLFMKLSVAKGKKILEQMKTPDELKLMHELLEQLRLARVEGYADTSGKTDGGQSQ
ncbi:hypothetical protein RAS1_18610 [Phycisphaerae bacterium RAS1]|nr:hypothetical protein RAS1_18610 [Phycisphaerae bacterium RAS1]